MRRVHRIAVEIDGGDAEIGILGSGIETKLDVVGSSSSADDLLGSLVAFGIVGDNLELTGFIANVHPAQTIAVETVLAVRGLGIGKHRRAAPRHGFFNAVGKIVVERDVVLADATLALAVDEELGFRIVGIAEDGRHFTFAAWPGPVGEQMEGLLFGSPMDAIKVGAILGKSGEVKDAEVAAARWPVFIVGRRLAKIVEACPYEFSDNLRALVLPHPVVVGDIAPDTRLKVVAGDLAVVVGGAMHFFDREFIDATTGNGGCRLGAEDDALGRILDALGIDVQTVVETRDVGLLPYAAEHRAFATIHTLRAGTCAIKLMDDLLHQFRIFVAHFVVLFGYLVADAPHNDAGMVAMHEDEVGEVALPPGFARAVDGGLIDLLEEAAVAVLALGIDPHVHRFGHDHHAHFVADIHLPGGGHVVRGADGIAAYLLEQSHLTTEGRLVEG